MRRRVALERAAWQLARGVPVTDAAFAAGYGSVEGFARVRPRLRASAQRGDTPGRQRLGALAAAPSYFHAPDGLWVEGRRGVGR